MKDPVGAEIVGVRTSDDADDREVLAVGAGDRVQNAESTDGEGHNAGTDSTRSSVTVGGVPGV